MVVVLIGTNNLPHIQADQIHTVALGIQAIVKVLRNALPKSTILLNEVFPRSDGNARAGAFVDVLNGLMENWYNEKVARNANENHFLKYLRCGGVYLSTHTLRDESNKTGDDSFASKPAKAIKVNSSLMPDSLHPNAVGMKMWLDDCILPQVIDIMKSHSAK